jgi:ArsR family metal-binding transcriptional regulator
VLVDPDSVEITCSQDHPGDEDWLAKARVPSDMTPLMPYINAVVKRADYYTDVPAIIWMHGDRRVAVRPHEIAVSHVGDTEEAAVEVGRVVEWLNHLWERREDITPRPEPKSLPPLMSVLRLLPMNNCGECDLPTCTAFAVNLIEGERRIEDCPALTSEKGKKSTEALKDMGLG